MNIKNVTKSLNPLLWIAIAIYFGKILNFSLIKFFDKNRFIYVFLVFPTYYFVIVFSLLFITKTATILDIYLLTLFVVSIGVIFIGIPMIMSVILAMVMFIQAILELFAKLRFPFAKMGIYVCRRIVETFRPGNRFNLFW